MFTKHWSNVLIFYFTQTKQISAELQRLMNQNHLKNTFNIFENDYYAIIPSREAAKTPTSGKTFNFNLHNEQTQLFEQYNLNKDGKTQWPF